MAKYSSSAVRGLLSRGVSLARLSQKSGISNSFGGYTKVNLGSGKFIMRKIGK